MTRSLFTLIIGLAVMAMLVSHAPTDCSRSPPPGGRQPRLCRPAVRASHCPHSR